jgi:GntR family transcriptional regulator of vanillate catabolism
MKQQLEKGVANMQADQHGDVHERKGAGTVTQTMRTLLALRELILDGELPPGVRISELWVSERLGVSRTPVRAALIRLEEEGLLESIPAGGFAARSFTASEIGDSIDLRGALEGFAARLAAERGVDRSTMRDLRDCVEQIDEILEGELSHEKFSAYVDANGRFHRVLAGACNSSVVTRQIDRVMTLPFASASAFVMVQSIDAGARDMLLIAQSQHRAVLDAIENREGSRAEALMREHAKIAHHNLKAALDSHKALTQLAGGKLIRMPGRRA